MASRKNTITATRMAAEMKIKSIFGIMAVGFLLAMLSSPLPSLADGPYDWQTPDAYDEIRQRYDSVTPDNCASKPADELHLPSATVAQPIRFNQLLTQIIFPNRTAMMHVHNMALNRAFFFSYMFQKLNTSETFSQLPGLFYHYFSMAADVSANPDHINGSAIFMDFNCTHANWYRNLPFNTTLPLFGPRGWRLDDFQYPTNWLREPTNRTIDIRDYGAGSQSNYTSNAYKINEWYQLWLPDGKDKAGLDSKRKQSYDIGIKYSNQTGKFIKDEYVGFTFFGPPSPGINEKQYFPVLFTEPYFDCGRLNRWIVSAVAPIVDWMPRYLDWLHLRRFQFVGVAVMDMEFLFLDMNQCPVTTGNPAPNYLADTARCKTGTTQCEPNFGWGFRRGGYQCNCLPGYRYPPWQRGPFQGIQLESATKNEYDNFFDCLQIDLRQILPVIRGNDSFGTIRQLPSGNRGKRDAAVEEDVFYRRNEQERRAERAAKVIKYAGPMTKVLDTRNRFLRSVGLAETTDTRAKRGKRFVPRYDYAPTQVRRDRKKRFVSRFDRDDEAVRAHRKKRSFDPEMRSRMDAIIRHKEAVTKDTCGSFKPEDLRLPGDVAHNADKLFTFQAKTALRLSHLLSNFLQNVDKYEEYGNLRGDRPLNIEQVFGESLANVMGDLKIMGSGVFFDTDKWQGDNDPRQYFGPYAFRYLEPGVNQEDHAQTNFRAIDYAGFPTTYLSEPWFARVKERWASNTYGLTKFTEAPMIRSDLDGTSLNKFQIYPLYYSAPVETDGWWSEPYYDCDGYVNEWVITYSVPFFGFNSIRALEFKGVVIVDIKLDHLDLNQCPMDFSVANAFKNTARCYYDNQYCVPLPGRGWMVGAYICECEQAFEYPFNDRAWYYDGQTMEEEYRKQTTGEPSRYHTLKCRFSAAAQVSVSWMLAAAAALLAVALRHL